MHRESMSNRPNGLEVWFLLWVQKVPSSILGSDPSFVMFIDPALPNKQLHENESD